MKPLWHLALIFGFAVSISAEETTLRQEEDLDRLLPIPSTEFIPPPPPKPVPAIKIEESTARQFPTHRITILRGDASALPDIPPPPEPKISVPGPVGEPHYLLSFGATVYDHRLSHVKWFDPRTEKHFEAWCAWDWTLLAPMPEIVLGERVSSFHLFAFNIDTDAALRFGRGFKIPEHPDLEAGEFVITKGDENAPEATDALTAIRDFHQKYHERLIRIRQAHEEYKAASDAWHAAHPPRPQNHTFWLKPHRGSRYLKEKGEER
ncbi:MAG: hypothetical protein KDN05_22145 [Verrucomicrobiae bacterium]|nr:hypothetical protein [Verrucomicrobiae bacterium]